MKIAVLVSGGVDSSVALKLLVDQGYEVTAFYLKIWLEDELSYLGECPWEVDLHYVSSVCKQLGVPLEIISLQKEYWQYVVRYVIAEVSSGRTPSPDLLCNQFIKFGCFYEQVGSSFDYIATGHYAQIDAVQGASRLKLATDLVKDQTYFLSRLSEQQLKRALFPIGHLYKHEVRSLAQSHHLETAQRKDSQGICFLGKINFNDFIRSHTGVKKGPLIEFETGICMGEHEGFWFYTIGQRKGIGLSGGPWYVIAKNPTENSVFISRMYHAPDKLRNKFFVSECLWICFQPPQHLVCKIKVRHGVSMYQGELTFTDAERTKGFVILNERDQGLAPGQFAVFYDNDVCLGSGIITTVEL